METARPATSSSGETILEPEDKRASDLLNSALDSDSNRALVCADMFVLMTILTPSMSHPLRGIFLRDIPAARRTFEGVHLLLLLTVYGRQPPVSNGIVSAL